MNKKQFIFALIACVVLGVAYFFMNNKKSPSKQNVVTTRSKLLPTFDPNAVEKMVLKSPRETFTLEKKEGTWTLPGKYDYPADFRKLQRLMLILKELKVAQSVKAGKSMFGRLRLNESGSEKEQGDQLELLDKSGKTIVKMIVGKEHFPQSKANNNPMFGPQPDGRYLLVEGATQPVLVGNPLRDLNPAVDAWIDHSFFAVTKIKSIKSTSADEKDSWTLTRKDEKSDFECLVTPMKGHEIDTSVITAVASSFAGYSFEELKPKAELKLDHARTVVIKTFEDFTYELKVVKLDDGYYIQPTISAEIPKERTSGKDEKPEDKDKLDKEFNKMVEARKNILKNQTLFNNWAYKIPDAKGKELLRLQIEFLKEIEKKDDKKTEVAPAK